MSFGGRIREIKARLSTLKHEQRVLQSELSELERRCDHRRIGSRDNDKCPDCGVSNYDINGW